MAPRHIGVIHTQLREPDRERPLQQRTGAGVLAQVLIHPPNDAEHLRLDQRLRRERVHPGETAIEQLARREGRAARRGTYLATASVLFLAASLLFTLNAFGQPVRVFNPENAMVRMDGVALFLCAVVLIAGMLTVLSSSKYLEHIHSNWGEFYTLVLSSVTGMMFLAAASDLLMLFLALELMSIPVYALAGFRRASLRSNESAVKYFLIGSFASVSRKSRVGRSQREGWATPTSPISPARASA